MKKGVIGKLLVGLARRWVPSQLTGSLAVTLPWGEVETFGTPGTDIDAALTLRNLKVIWASIRRAQLGFFDCYMAGDIDTPDPTRLLTFYLRNRHALDRASKGVFFPSLFDMLWHKDRDNTREGAKDNIAEHYDLGNAFYKAWLDDTMSYSSAIFDNNTNSLEAAQKLKLRHVMEAAEVTAQSHVLEIGCGWGGFAEAAAQAGATVTGITLSKEQLAFAQERIARQDLETKCTFHFEDYRDTKGVFDAIASVEMIEAVGEAHWPSYFSTLFQRLKPGGAAAIQGITIREENYDYYRSGVDFIQRFIFPGGMLLTKDIMQDQAQKAGLVLEKTDCFGLSYAETLRQWRQRFEAAWPKIQPLGFDERFRRMWRMYLCYCEAGFQEGIIDVGIYKLRKPA
jgi:cyclopropane-fatty-acyl-phospholipid synthase